MISQVTYGVRAAVLAIIAAICSQAAAQPRDIYFVGNSLTNGVRLNTAFRDLVESQGHSLSGSLPRDDFAQIVAGAPLWYHWYQQSVHGDFYYNNFQPEIQNNTWDALVLQPYGSALEQVFTTLPERMLPTRLPAPRDHGDVHVAGEFISLMTQGVSTNVDVYVYSTWPKIPETNGQIDHAAFDYKEIWERGIEEVTDLNRYRNRAYFDALRQGLSDNWLGQPGIHGDIKMIPVGEVLYELNNRLRASPMSLDGGVVDDVEDLYSDTIHLKAGIGRYLSAISMYAVLYNENPTGLPIGMYNDVSIYNTAFQADIALITPEWQALLQEVTWDVVSEFIAPPPVLGDLNGDGSFTNGDISAFVQALSDPALYASTYPEIDPGSVGDFTGDGALTNGDITGFIAALSSGGSASVVPEPGSLVFLGLTGLLVVRRRPAHLS